MPNRLFRGLIFLYFTGNARQKISEYSTGPCRPIFSHVFRGRFPVTERSATVFQVPALTDFQKGDPWEVSDNGWTIVQINCPTPICHSVNCSRPISADCPEICERWPLRTTLRGFQVNYLADLLIDPWQRTWEKIGLHGPVYITPIKFSYSGL